MSRPMKFLKKGKKTHVFLGFYVFEGPSCKILKCENCGKNYRLISKELVFYKRFKIPIPRKCFVCRDQARIQALNPIKIYDRRCAKCDEKIKTSYALERPEIVYCEKCYQQEVY